jgi:signal transduction histidine kinase
MFSSLRRQLTFGFIGLAIIPLLLAGLVSSSASFRAQERDALALQQEVTRRISSQISALIGQIENELRQLTRVGSFAGLDTDEQKVLLSELLSYQDGLESVALLDGDGQERARVERMRFVPESGLGDWSQTNEFRSTIASGAVYYGSLIFDDSTSEPMMYLAYPLADLRTGAVGGVLVAEIRIRKVWELIRDSDVPGDEQIYVVDQSSRIVAHAMPSVVLRGTSFALPGEFGITTGLDGDQVVLAWDEMQLGDQTLFVVAEQPVSEALALAYQTLNVTIGLMAGAVFVAGLAVVLAVRHIVRPIESLSATAEKIAAGDLSQQAHVEGAAEIEALAGSFNTMTAQLLTTLEGLELLNADLERRVAERTAELEAANRRLTELDRLKTMFIQDMSHELRTPLTVLGTSVYLLERKPEQTAEYLQKLKDQIAKLTHLANSALDLLRLEQRDVVFEPVSLNEIVEQVANGLTARAESVGLQFTVQPDAQLKAIHGNADQLTQVVTHLLTNAINYTPAGSIEVSTHADQERACLQVRDTGRGITTEDIPHLFDRFYRGKGVGSSTISGSGLGLAIVKQIVDLHQGSIEVESMVDKGTTFRIWLPLANGKVSSENK